MRHTRSVPRAFPARRRQRRQLVGKSCANPHLERCRQISPRNKRKSEGRTGRSARLVDRLRYSRKRNRPMGAGRSRVINDQYTQDRFASVRVLLMQWSGLILRTALAIGLIFNGSAYAFASVDMRMPMAHAGGGDLPTSASRVTASHTNAQPPCHDPSGTKSSSSQAADSTSHTGQASGATDQDLPDCCKSGNSSSS